MSRRRTSVAAGSFVRPAGKSPAGFRASPSSRAEVPGPAVRSLQVFLSSAFRGVSPSPGAFIGWIRLDPLCRAGVSVGAGELNFAKKSASFWEGESPFACPDRRHRQPPNQPLTHAHGMYPVVSSFPPLLPRWTVVTRARSDKNDPDADMLLAAAAYYSPPTDFSARHVAAPQECEHKSRPHVLDDHRCITDDEEHPHLPDRRGETAGRRVAQAWGPRRSTADGGFVEAKRRESGSVTTAAVRGAAVRGAVARGAVARGAVAAATEMG